MPQWLGHEDDMGIYLDSKVGCTLFDIPVTLSSELAYWFGSCCEPAAMVADAALLISAIGLMPWIWLVYLVSINSACRLPFSVAYLRQWTRLSLVQVMACRLFGAKTSPESMLAYCQPDSWEQISVKFRIGILSCSFIYCSISCRRWTKYIYFLYLTHGFNGLHKDNYKARRATSTFLDLVAVI